MASIIKCPQCNTFSNNSDYCDHCGELISYEIKTSIRKEEERQKRVAEIEWKRENPNWVERMKAHGFFPYRIIGWILYSAFLVVSAIGGAIAWFVAMAAAG